MSELLKNIDGRTRLAGTNKLEILMFTLGEDAATGRREVFGINVFKVREVMRTPAITRAPEMPNAVEGMVSLRGKLTPVVDLAKYAGVSVTGRPEIMIVTEYNGHTQGFLVEAVDTILRLDWSKVRVPPQMIAAGMGGLVTAVTERADGQLVMMLDVEKVLAETARFDDEAFYRGIEPGPARGHTVFFADDSSIARKQIARTLDTMNVRHSSAINGAQAWQALQKIANEAEAAGKPVREHVSLILTDVEMPEMDGYMLTKQIKGDPRFAGVPVVMHSSLSGASNQQLGQSVGADEYVSKFEPARLAQTISRLLACAGSRP
jgi:two-component system chemotaxis response regulator CheV